VDGTNEKLGTIQRDAQSLLGVTPAILRSSDGPSLYRQLGCPGCHEDPAVAPTLVALRGQRIALADGRYVTVDSTYLRESIVAPAAALALGYGPTMPSYQADLTRQELQRLVDYVSHL